MAKGNDAMTNETMTNAWEGNRCWAFDSHTLVIGTLVIDPLPGALTEMSNSAG